MATTLVERTNGRISIRTLSTAASGSAAESLCGAIAVLTSVIGLAGAAPRAMASASSVLLGCAFLVEGGALAGLTRFFCAEHELESKLGGVTGAEFFGGWTGVLCGILAALGVSPAALLPMASIVFGGALMMGSASFTPIDRLPVAARPYRRQGIAAAAGGEVIAGLASLFLGMFALTRWANVEPMTYTLIALLCASVAVLMGGAAARQRIRVAV